MKGQKVPLSNKGEIEPGFRDFQRALLASPLLPLTQVESVFMILTGTGRLILSVSAWCILMHLQLLISTREYPCRSLCAGLNRKTLFILELSSIYLFWLHIKFEHNYCRSNKGLGRWCVCVFEGRYSNLTLCYVMYKSETEIFSCFNPLVITTTCAGIHNILKAYS